MARITVEDCLENVENRFELVMVAAKRARDLSLYGVPATLEWENDKATVMALREIAAGTIDRSVLDNKPGQTPTPLRMSTKPVLKPAAAEDEDDSDLTDL